jgi:hypothetical protein
MRRYHWLKVDLNPSLLSILRRGMLRLEYGSSRESGFRLERASNELIVGRYIERFETTEAVDDPLGGTVSFTRVGFDVVRFQVSGEFPQLQLVDPPRSNRSFLSRLAQMCGFSVAISAPDVSLSKWIASVQQRVDGLLVTRVMCSGIDLSERASASIAVEGTEDVRTHLGALLGNRRGTLDRVRMQLKCGEMISTCEVRRSGVAQIEDEDSEKLLPIIRASLAEALG